MRRRSQRRSTRRPSDYLRFLRDSATAATRPTKTRVQVPGSGSGCPPVAAASAGASASAAIEARRARVLARADMTGPFEAEAGTQGYRPPGGRVNRRGAPSQGHSGRCWQKSGPRSRAATNRRVDRWAAGRGFTAVTWLLVQRPAAQRAAMRPGPTGAGHAAAQAPCDRGGTQRHRPSRVRLRSHFTRSRTGCTQPGRGRAPRRHAALAVRVGSEVQAGAVIRARSKTRRLDRGGSRRDRTRPLPPAVEPAGRWRRAVPGVLEDLRPWVALEAPEAGLGVRRARQLLQ